MHDYCDQKRQSPEKSAATLVDTGWGGVLAENEWEMFLPQHRI